MQPFEIIPDLRIGSILEVSGTSIRVELDGDLTELARSFDGHVYAVGQMASVLKVHFGRKVIFAFVRMLRMRSELLAEEGIPSNQIDTDSRILEADLFGEGLWNKHKKRLMFERGLKTYPLPQQGVHLTTQIELQHLYRGAETLVEGGVNRLIQIGSYANSSSTPCHADADKLFGQHCAILGSTGSGKSGTVSSLLHAILEKKNENIRPRIIVIDPHGEYGQCFGDRAVVYRAYNNLGQGEGEGTLLRLPYWLMCGDEFRSLVIGKGEHEATTQHNIVYRALSHSRMVERGMVAPATDWTGNPPDSDPLQPSPLGNFTKANLEAFDRDLPIPFKLQEFEDHVTLHQGVAIKGTGTNKTWDKMSTSAFSAHQSILNKLSVLKSDPRINFMMEEHSETSLTLPKIIEQFVGYGDDERDIRVIDISGLPNEVAGPLTALIARLLFQYKVWETREEREKDPVLIVCEEVHRYVPRRGEAEYAEAQKAIQRLAKEGRKYGIGLMLVSQRPSDVDSTVISQCNSWIILRLTNASDQDHVRRYLPDNLAGMTRILPSLARREALFVGEAASIPARINIRHLATGQLPDSNDTSFIEGWMNSPENNDHISIVTDRWQRS